MQEYRLSWEYKGQTIQAQIEYGVKDCSIQMLSPYIVSLCGGHMLGMVPVVYAVFPEEPELREKREDRLIKINLIPRAKSQCKYWLDNKEEQIAIDKKAKGFIEYAKATIDITTFRDAIFGIYLERKALRKGFKEKNIDGKKYQFGLKDISNRIYHTFQDMDQYIKEFGEANYPNFVPNQNELECYRYMQVEEDNKALSGLGNALCNLNGYFENTIKEESCNRKTMEEFEKRIELGNK